MSSAQEATATPTATESSPAGFVEGASRYLDTSQYSSYTLSRLSAYGVTRTSTSTVSQPGASSGVHITSVSVRQGSGEPVVVRSSSITSGSTSPCGPCAPSPAVVQSAPVIRAASPCGPCGTTRTVVESSPTFRTTASACNPCAQLRATPVIASPPLNPCRPCAPLQPAVPAPSPCRPSEPFHPAPSPCRPCGTIRTAPAPCQPCAAPSAPPPCRPCATTPAPVSVPVPCGAPGTPCGDKVIRGGYIRIGNEYHPLDSPIAQAHSQGYVASLPSPYSSAPPTTFTTISAGTYSTATEYTPLVQPYPAASYVEVPVTRVPATTAAKKVIVVFGATGSQGRGLVDAILEDRYGPFSVRAVTRDVNSAGAKELASLGAEVVAASLDDPASVEKALEGAYGAYFVTFFWDHFSPEKEMQHARLLAESAKKAGLQHAIWSTLEDTRKFVPLDDPRMPTLYGKYKVAHFDVKGEADEYFRQLGVPTTFLLTSFYWDNFVKFGMGPKRGPDGKLALTLPIGDKRLPQIWAGDIGRCAYGVFKGGAQFIGQYVGVAGDHLTGYEMAEALTRAFGEEVVYNPVPPDVYRSFGFPGADDLGNMFQFNADFSDECCAARDIQLCLQLNPGLLTLDQYLQLFKHLIPIEPPAAAAKKVIVVFGATGTQARGLVDAILEDPAGEFSARAVTRDVNSAKAKELARLGAEVVQASLDDPASVEAALTGAYGAFFVTFFFEHFNPEKEKDHAYTLAAAAKNTGLQHVIWSTLEDTRRFMSLDDPRMPTLFGKYKVAHFDAKGESDEFFRELGVPTTYLLTSFYWDNFTNYGMGPKRGEDGKLTLALPMAHSKLPGLWSGDIGRCAYAILKAGEPYINKYVGLASEHLTGEQMAAVFSKVIGEPVSYYPIPPDTYRSLGFPGAEDMGNMFQFKAEFEAEFCGPRDPWVARQLNPGMLSLEQYLRNFPVAIQ